MKMNVFDVVVTMKFSTRKIVSRLSRIKAINHSKKNHMILILKKRMNFVSISTMSIVDGVVVNIILNCDKTNSQTSLIIKQFISTQNQIYKNSNHSLFDLF
jgi:hypothetical protein